ncbi:MAG: hypothetical protein JWO46_385 [Nocardioidaceae bacterium]|nr:hypothetical protein [Nocardioidaceae bacterium]
MSTFLVTLVSGASWDDAVGRRDQSGWTEHAAFMDALVADRTVVLGGPIGDGERVALVVEAADEDAVRRALAADPWLVDPVLAIAAIEPWTIWLDGRAR